jgi:hypothetical protein
MVLFFNEINNYFNQLTANTVIYNGLYYTLDLFSIFHYNDIKHQYHYRKALYFCTLKYYKLIAFSNFFII